MKATQCDPCEFAPPFLLCRVNTDSYHLSMMDGDGYSRLAVAPSQTKVSLRIGWPKDYSKLPVMRRNPTRLAGIAPAVELPGELIGPVESPGGDGPTDGMYALQKELRKRIKAGVDWLSIRRLPVRDGTLPWF
jgi:hypothetical protein